MQTSFLAPGANPGDSPSATARLDNTVTNKKYSLLKVLFKTEPEQRSQNKVILCGHFVETYTFEKPVVINRKPTKPKKPIRKELVEEVRRSRRDEYRKRTKNRVVGIVQRLVEANFTKDSVFLTLTFNNENNFDISDLSICNHKLHDFMVKIKNKYSDFKYLIVPEFQKRGAVHYHMIINVQFFKKKYIQKLWKYGFIKLKDIYYLHGIGNYFTKYLVKNSDDDRLFGRRSYFTSKNMRRPKIKYLEYADIFIKGLAKNNIHSFYKNQYKSEYNGIVTYQKFYIESKIHL